MISKSLEVRALFFFFQAEDGIRDLTVTGVQTCALPIYRAARADSLVGTQHHGEGAHHEHDGAPGSGLGKNVGGTARAESGLAARATEGTGEVGGFAALEQHDDDQNEAIQNEKTSEQPPGEPEADDNYAKADEESECPLHCSFCFHASLLSENQERET